MKIASLLQNITPFIYPIITCLVFLLISYAMSSDKRQIKIKPFLLCIFWQTVLAVALSQSKSAFIVFEYINLGLLSISESTLRAMKVCFGSLADADSIGFILGFQVFPILITISAISALLNYWKILPSIIKIFSIFFRKTLGVSGTLGVASSTNMFTGMSETPLIIKSYLTNLSKNELLTLMACGAACTASSMIIMYSQILKEVMPNAVGHLITATIINIPCAIAFSKIILPQTETQTQKIDDIQFSTSKSSLDALSTGIIDGGKVVVMILLMIVGFIAVLDITDTLLGALPINLNGQGLSLSLIFGYILSPLAYILGVPWEEAGIFGSVLGTKLISNEILGFGTLAQQFHMLSDTSQIISVYSVCGFANIGSIGIMIGIYSVLLDKSKKNMIIEFAWKAVVIGTMSNCLSASLMGAIVSTF